MEVGRRARWLAGCGETAFSSSLISFLKPRPLGAIAKMCCRTLACRSVTSMSRKDRSEKNCLPSLLWVQVFNLHFPDTMTRCKSCRHKRYRNLILTDFEPELFELWVHVFNP